MEKRIVILIPAHNEGNRIEAVLDVVCSYPREVEIIVIDGGSKDDTKEKASKYPVEVISYKENRGKGAALQAGIDHAVQADYWLFIDADLVNLQHNHLDQLLQPMMDDPETGMTVGRLVEGGKKIVDIVQCYISITNGQRGLAGWFASRLPDMSWSRFGVEVFMSRLSEHWDIKIETPHLHGVTHYPKEEKFGLIRGFYYRMHMYAECMHAVRVWKRYSVKEKDSSAAVIPSR